MFGGYIVYRRYEVTRQAPEINTYFGKAGCSVQVNIAVLHNTLQYTNSMKQVFKTTLIICLVIPVCLAKTFGQATTREITDRFFTLYAKDPAQAIDYAFSTNQWMDRKIDEVANLKNTLKNLVDLCGDYYGYEMLSEKTAGQHIKLVTFIVKYAREPIRFTFFFYKPNDKWQLNNFSYDENIDQDLEEATRAYRLAENMN